MKKNTLCLALASALLMPVLAQAVGNTKAIIIASAPTSSNSPVGEAVINAVDGNTASKYLNFDKLNTGLMVTLDQPRAIETITLTTANDAAERDPSSILIYGSNTNATNGYVGIASQNLSLSSSRGASSQFSFTNSTAYKYYKVIFPTIKSSSLANSMQIAEVSLLYANGAAAVYQVPSPFTQTTTPVYTPPPAPVAPAPSNNTCPLSDGFVAIYPWANSVDVTTFQKCAVPAMGVYTLNTVNKSKREVFRRGNTPQGYWETQPALNCSETCCYPAGISPSAKAPGMGGLYWTDLYNANQCAQPGPYGGNLVFNPAPAPKGSWVLSPAYGGVSLVASSPSSAVKSKKHSSLFSTKNSDATVTTKENVDTNLNATDDQTVFAANLCILPDGTWIGANGTTGGWSSTEDGQLHLGGNNESFGLSAVLNTVTNGEMAGQILEWDTASPTAEQTVFQTVVNVQDSSCAGIDTEKMRAGGYVPAPTDGSVSTDTTSPTEGLASTDTTVPVAQ